MDEKSGFSKLNTKEAGEKFQKNMETVHRKNVNGLTKMLKKTFHGEKIKDMTEDMMLATCLPALEADMFQSYPLLWASLALSSGEEEDTEVTISRSDKEKLLCGISKLLCALKRISSSASQTHLATIMNALFEKVQARLAVDTECFGDLFLRIVFSGMQHADLKSMKIMSVELSQACKSNHKALLTKLTESMKECARREVDISNTIPASQSICSPR
jgi:hypothetical protein